MHSTHLPSILIAVIMANGGIAHGASPAAERTLVLQSSPEVSVTAVTVSPDGTLIATDSFDGRVRILDARSGTLLRAIDAGGGRGVTFTPDGKCLAAAGYHMDKLVGIYDVKTGKRLQALAGHTEWETYAIAISPDGKLLASAGTDKQILIWDLASGNLRHQLLNQPFASSALAFSPDGSTLASGGGAKTVELWNTASGQLRQTLTGHRDWICTLAFSADGKMLTSGSCDWSYHRGRDVAYFAGRVPDCESQWILWDTETGKLKRTATMPGRLLSLAMTPDGKSLLGGIGTAVQRFDLQSSSQNESQFITRHDHAVTSIAVTRDGRSVISVSHDHSVKRVALATGDVEWQSLGYWEHVNSVSLSHDAKLLATGSSDYRFAVRVLPAGGKGMGPGAIRLWDPKNCRLVRRLGDPTEQVMAVALSPDGSRVISGSMTRDGAAMVRAWDTASGMQVWEHSDHTQEVLAIDFSRDGSSLATAGADGVVRLREPATGKVLRTLAGHEGGATSLAFSTDGKTLVCGAGHGTASVWDVVTGKRLQKCTAGSQAESVTTDRLFTTVALTPDAKTLATCTATSGNTYGDRVRFWDTQTGELKQEIADQPFQGHPLALSPDGSILATGGKVIKLVDWRSGKLLHRLLGHFKKTQSIKFSADGRLIFSGGGYGTTNVWDVASGRHLVTLFTFCDIQSGNITDDWMAYTPEGYYDGSPGVERYLAWRVGDELQFDDSIRRQFHQPQRIASVLQSDAGAATATPNVSQR